MKKSIQKTVAVLLSLLFIASSLSVVAAAAVISTTEIERIADIPDKGFRYGSTHEKCTNNSGIAIGKGANSMFVIKSSSLNHEAALFYFPEIPDGNDSSDPIIIRIANAGHANAMAIDNNNLYITGWVRSTATTTGTIYGNNNTIIKIPRTLIAQVANSNTTNKIISEATSTTAGYTRLYPKYLDGNTYKNYDGKIQSISKAQSNGTFIIEGSIDNYSNPNDDFIFTTARLQTVGGVERFVVSKSPSDMFIVKNNLSNHDPVDQDIGYSINSGFFAAKWYGNDTSSSGYQNKNVIAWADIFGAPDDVKVINNASYNYFVPDKININVNGLTDGGVKIYDQFEIESVAFNANDEMFVTANVVFTEAYKDIFGQSTYNSTFMIEEDNIQDAVFKITHDNGSNFTLN